MKSRMRLRGRRQVFRLELLGPGRTVGLQARRLAETLGRRASQRRLLCDRRGGHRDRLRARPGVRQGRPPAADRHQPRFHVEPADPGGQVPADRRRQARPALEGLARRALDGLDAPRRFTCGRCSRRTTSRTVGAVLRRRRGILPCISASSTMFLPVGRLLACGFASDADRQKLSGSRTSPTRRRDCRNPCICPCYRVSFRLYSGRMR